MCVCVCIYIYVYTSVCVCVRMCIFVARAKVWGDCKFFMQFLFAAHLATPPSYQKSLIKDINLINERSGGWQPKN